MTTWPLSPRLREYLEVQYELRRVLGEGGMGVVLLATERVLDRQVAIKVLRRDAADQPELRERFRREARVAAQLQHPNIVPLHTFGDVDGELFFVMGFVEGETLADQLKRVGRVPQDDATRILREVCDALALAHSKGVVHRDIKPENVLIEARTGRALLADFGIARDGSSGDATGLTGTGMAIGTPHYMAPEQAMPDGTVDHRADIYAVGVMAYRMLAGRLPFDGANVREVLAQQMVAKPRELGGDSGLSAQVAAAVMRCLEKDPDMRWSDATALRDSIAPGVVDDEEDLPDELRNVDGTLPTLAALSLGSLWGVGLNRWWENDLLTALLPIGVFAPPFAALFLGLLTGRRMGLRRTFEVLARPPKVWSFWWPRRFRRPGDVWDRLPTTIRVARSTILASLLVSAPFVAGQVLLVITLPPEKAAQLYALPFLKPLSAAAAALALGGFYAGAIMMHLWWRKHGRPKHAGRVPWFSEANASPRWRRPEFARFLLPTGTRGANVPDSVDRLGAAIGDGVRVLVGKGVLDSAAPAEVARDVVTAIAAIDRELEMLAKGGDAAELKKLDDRISAMRSGAGGLGAGLNEMLERQRDAIVAIIRRQDEQRNRRERLVARLRELFLALDDVRQRASSDPAPEITGRIDLVCGDFKRLAAGYDELRDSATTPIA